MMAEFASFEDWGLQAIVRGKTSGYYCNTSDAISSATTANQSSFFGPLDIPKDDHGLFATAAMLTDELQELYKPFYTVSHSSTAENSPSGTTSHTVNPLSVFREVKEEAEEVEEKLNHMDQSPADSITAPSSAYIPKYKRRKNQHKRVVVHVTANDLSSDVWAWRKYGQKPIKGSPYPRSYYKCSSSKGCLARKQVEQSCTDSSIFIVTYTAEHNHTQPTRKNALAGTVRQKFSASKSPIRNNSRAAKKGDSGRYSSSPSLDLSSETPLLAEEDEFRRRNIERENKDENDGQMVDVSSDNGILFQEIMFDDDFFSGLGDLDGFMSELVDMSEIL